MISVNSVEQYRALMNHIFHISYMSHKCEELVIQNDTYESYTRSISIVYGRGGSVVNFLLIYKMFRVVTYL